MRYTLLLVLLLPRIVVAQTDPERRHVQDLQARIPLIAEATILAAGADSLLIDGLPIGIFRITLTLTRRWKGAGPDTVIARYGRNIEAPWPAPFPMAPGSRLLVYLESRDSSFWGAEPWLADRSRALEAAALDLALLREP